MTKRSSADHDAAAILPIVEAVIRADHLADPRARVKNLSPEGIAKVNAILVAIFKAAQSGDESQVDAMHATLAPERARLLALVDVCADAIKNAEHAAIMGRVVAARAQRFDFNITAERATELLLATVQNPRATALALATRIYAEAEAIDQIDARNRLKGAVKRKRAK